jgi:putative flippase GtrA
MTGATQAGIRALALRWLKFHAVGGIGVVVQLGFLAFFKSVLGMHYLVATALAVEVAVLHNFWWHERWTWVERTRAAPGFGLLMQRLLRFNLTSGAISILSNLVLMRIFVGQFHVPYLAANLTIVIVGEFLLSGFFAFKSGKVGSGAEIGKRPLKPRARPVERAWAPARRGSGSGRPGRDEQEDHSDARPLGEPRARSRHLRRRPLRASTRVPPALQANRLHHHVSGPEGGPPYDLLTGFEEWVFPVGRLDLDTSGLLLLTNDAQFAERITNPSYKVPKTYLVKAATRLTEEQLDLLRKGVMLKDGPTKPAPVTRLRDSSSKTFFESPPGKPASAAYGGGLGARC